MMCVRINCDLTGYLDKFVFPGFDELLVVNVGCSFDSSMVGSSVNFTFPLRLAID